MISLLMLGGCITAPKNEVPALLRAPQTLAADTSFAAVAGEFPDDRWWTALGDPALTALIEEGLTHSPDAAAAAARMRAAAAMAREAGAARFPEIGIEASAGGQKQSQNQGFPPQFISGKVLARGRLATTFDFDPDLWGKNRAALAAATSEARAAAVDAAQARLMLGTAIAAGYTELYRNFLERDAAAEALRIAEATATLTAQRMAEGLDNTASLRQAQSQSADARGDLAALDQAIGLSRNALAALVGAGPDRGLTIKRPALRPGGQAALPPNLPLDLIGRRPDLVAARLRSEAAAARIKVARADFYPSVNLSAVAGLQSIGFDTLLNPSSRFVTFGPALRLPIFGGGAPKARYRGARARYDEAVAQYDATLVAAFRDVADAITRKRALAAQIDAARAAYVARHEAQALIDLRHRNGLANLLQLLAAQDMTATAQRQLAIFEAMDIETDIALIRALGGGFADASPSPIPPAGIRP